MRLQRSKKYRYSWINCSTGFAALVCNATRTCYFFLSVLCLPVCVKWSTGKKLENIKNDAKFHDVAWITLMGNDAQAQVLLPRPIRISQLCICVGIQYSFISSASILKSKFKLHSYLRFS